MSYLALFTADWQLCNSLPYAKAVGESETDRLHDQLAVLGVIKEIAKVNEVDGIFVLGDIFEKRLLDAVTLRRGVEAVYDLAMVAKVYLLPGNHDVHSARSTRFLPEVFEVLRHKNIMYLDGSQIVRVDPKLPIDVYAVPWSPASEAAEQLGKARARREGAVNVLLMHHSVNGCRDGGWVCDDGLDAKEVCDGWDLVLAGHFHERQKFGDCGEYVGAPMQHDFRDAGAAPRGVRLVEFSKEKIVKKFHEVKSPRFHVYEWDDPWDESAVEEDDYLRIDVRATHAEWKSKRDRVMEVVKGQRARGVHVLDPKHIPLQQVEERLDLSSAPSHSEVVAGYVEMANTEGLDEARLVEIGKELLEEVRDG